MVKVFNLPGGEVRVTIGNKRESDKMLGGRHFAYTCRIEYNGRKMTFPFHDSIANYYKRIGPTETLILQAVESVVLDSDAYDYNRDIDEFFNEFGYDNYADARKAYFGCMKAYQDLHELFNDDEIRGLYDAAEQRINEILGNN